MVVMVSLVDMFISNFVIGAIVAISTFGSLCQEVGEDRDDMT